MLVRGKKNPRFNKFKEDKNNGKIYIYPVICITEKELSRL